MRYDENIMNTWFLSTCSYFKNIIAAAVRMKQTPKNVLWYGRLLIKRGSLKRLKAVLFIHIFRNLYDVITTRLIFPEYNRISTYSLKILNREIMQLRMLIERRLFCIKVFYLILICYTSAFQTFIVAWCVFFNWLFLKLINTELKLVYSNLIVFINSVWRLTFPVLLEMCDNVSDTLS